MIIRRKKQPRQRLIEINRDSIKLEEFSNKFLLINLINSKFSDTEIAKQFLENDCEFYINESFPTKLRTFAFDTVIYQSNVHTQSLTVFNVSFLVLCSATNGNINFFTRDSNVVSHFHIHLRLHSLVKHITFRY